MKDIGYNEGPIGERISAGKTVSTLGWGVYIPALICLVLSALLYMPTFQSWYHAWMAEESYYSHGILIPVISLFIIWLKRNEIASKIVQPDMLGYLLILPSLMIVVLMNWAGGTSVQGFTFPIFIGGIVILLFGRAIAKSAVFPIGYLYFMCVLPGFLLVLLSFRIQVLSTIVATSMLRGLTIDAYREGVSIVLPNIEVLVGAPCSGFRLLISLFAFSTLFVYLKEGPTWGKIGLIVVTLPLSVLLNSIRIALIAIVGEFMGSDAMHAFHDYSGYIMLLLAFISLSLLSRLFKCQKFNSMLTS